MLPHFLLNPVHSVFNTAVFTVCKQWTFFHVNSAGILAELPTLVQTSPPCCRKDQYWQNGQVTPLYTTCELYVVKEGHMTSEFKIIFLPRFKLMSATCQCSGEVYEGEIGQEAPTYIQRKFTTSNSQFWLDHLKCMQIQAKLYGFTLLGVISQRLESLEFHPLILGTRFR